MSSNARSLARFLALIVIALCAACQYDPYGVRYADERPDEAALVGRYTLDSMSMGSREERQRLEPRDDEPPRPTLELRADGTFSVREFPIWIDRGIEDYELSHLEQVDGNWSIAVCGGSSSGPIWGVRFDPPLGEVTAVGGSQGTYELIFRYGDPDSGNALVYRRPDVSYSDVDLRAAVRSIPGAILYTLVFVAFCIAALFAIVLALALCAAVIVAALIAVVVAIAIVLAIVVAIAIAVAIAVALAVLIAAGIVFGLLAAALACACTVVIAVIAIVLAATRKST